MADTHIKAEADESSAIATPASEDDLYEDAGDLEFYDKNDGSAAFEKLWLARVPKYVWEAWMKMTERMGPDDEIQIGTVRRWMEARPDGTNEDKLRMLLHSNQPEHQVLPREYDLEITDRDVKNHFVFSEQDIEGYKAKNKARNEAAAIGIPAHVLRAREAAKDSAVQKPYDRRSRYQPYFRKAIPKKTRIFGRILYDMKCEPRDKTQETRLLGQHMFEAESKAPIRVLSRNEAAAITNPGATGSTAFGNNFIKNAAPIIKPKKGEYLKNARIPKNQLLDLIFECFREYQYWSMKALRQRTQQPDAWLREVLSEVCVLQKSGAFANHYSLNDAYRDRGGEAPQLAAAEAEDEGDDDDEEMEDVLPA